jgi:hypothetical protein
MCRRDRAMQSEPDVLVFLHGSITSTHILLPLRTVRSTWLYHVYKYTTTITYCSIYMALSRLHIYYYYYVLFSLHGSIRSTHILLSLRTVHSTWLYHVYSYTTTITYCSLYMALSRLHIYVKFIKGINKLLPMNIV